MVLDVLKLADVGQTFRLLRCVCFCFLYGGLKQSVTICVFPQEPPDDDLSGPKHIVN
jgi:hypothetical protein